jgi:DNA-directed RNA polymerase omega subunit
MKTPDFVNSVDTDKCVSMIGNRFNLVLVAALRARELKHGKGNRKMVTSPNSHIVTALQEIEAGHVGVEYLRKVR